MTKKERDKREALVRQQLAAVKNRAKLWRALRTDHGQHSEKLRAEDTALDAEQHLDELAKARARMIAGLE